ncbi:MAG TPA: glycosyl hydrolase, partial [Thermoanaerobaculia bacterium]|nr:glycosyl hydrolase [Thermoanaerobaculia bacterium]
MNPLLLLFTLATTPPGPAPLSGLEYRQLYFPRGGRSTAVTGVAADPFTFYFGGIGGGVWKSTDAGTTWRNVSDRTFEAGSVGAIAVSDSNPSIVYAGTGTACPRTNVSPGVGVYRSDDGGETWVHAGLSDAGQIGRIRIHPKNPDLVYAAVLGHASEPNATRGVFRSRDGGRSWQKVLFLSEGTGIADLTMDPADPRVLYAASWSFERKPWAFENGSTDGGIFKSADGGDTWTRLAGGLPSGVLGRTAVAVSPARPSRVWALIEAPPGVGGLFRSDDAGATWSRVNGASVLTQRASYHGHLTAHPVLPDVIYVLSTQLLKSTDGGTTFGIAPDSHEDHHDLWINPRDPRILINGNDGGATVSFNGGATWSTQMNQPTGEMYRLAVDTAYPYRVYSAQQDSGTVSVPTASRNVPLQLVDAYGVGGGEASSIAVDPRHPSIVYATINGQVARTDTARKTSELLQVYPEPRPGRPAILKYRTAWNMPLRLSPHDPDVLYVGSQYVHRSRDGGHSWEVISGDLTRNDKTKQERTGSRGLKQRKSGGEI